LLAIDPADTGGWAAGADPTWSHGFENANGALPPWTYPIQLAIVPPLSERAARVYLAALDAAALIVIASLAVVRAGSAAGPASALVVLSPPAIRANDNALTQGQNSLIVTAALAVVLLQLLRRRNDRTSASAGVVFALAMAKPSMAILFALPLAVQRRWRILGIAAAGLVAA